MHLTKGDSKLMDITGMVLTDHKKENSKCDFSTVFANNIESMWKYRQNIDGLLNVDILTCNPLL